MAYSLDKDIYDAMGNLFSSSYLTDKVTRPNIVKGKHKFLYEFMREAGSEKWKIPFNHIVPDIDYHATVIVTSDGEYYKHNDVYPKVDHKKYRMFFEEVIAIPIDEQNFVIVSFGTKYNYYYS